MIQPLSIEPLHKPIWKYLLPWVLVFPMVVFAVSSDFSFQAGARNTAAVSITSASIEGKGQREILISTYLILVLVLGTRYKRVLRMAAQMKALTCLGVLAAASAIWSGHPGLSFVRGSYYLFDTLFVFWLIQRFTTAQLRTFLMMVGSVVAASSIFMVIALPRFGLVGTLAHMGAWQGIFSEKNHAGASYVFLLTPVVDFTRRLNYKRSAYAAVICFLLIMSESRTAWIAGILYPLFILLLHVAKRLEKRFVLVICFVATVVTAVTAAMVLPNLGDILAFLGRDVTLTGRTEVWRLVVQAIAVKPILGYGYNAFWSGLDGPSASIILSLGWAFGYAHDGFFEILLQVGVVGLTLVAYILVKAVRESWQCFTISKDPQTYWYIGLVFLTLFYNIDEETLFFPHHLNTIFILLACCGLRLALQRAQAALRAQNHELHTVPGEFDISGLAIARA